MKTGYEYSKMSDEKLTETITRFQGIVQESGKRAAEAMEWDVSVLTELLTEQAMRQAQKAVTTTEVSVSE